jgi:hypothetical protein
MVVSMTKDEILLMAQKAQFFVKDNEAYSPSVQEDHELTECLERFAALVADHVYAQYLEQPTPNQTGVISTTIPEPLAYLCENAVGHKYFRWKKPSSVYKPIALYTKDQA